jgi:hypothetical protein
MAAAVRGIIDMYVRHFKLTPEEAGNKALHGSAEEIRERTVSGPPNEVSWFALAELFESDPEVGARRWAEIQRAALDELQTGHRAAVAVEPHDSTPWQRARFQALRHDLMEQWQPRGGVERQLIDTLAQAQTAWMYWMDLLAHRTTLEPGPAKRLAEAGFWEAPRVSDAEALEQAAAMAERFNRIFLRTLRALRDLRRYAPAVIVQNAGQVNVAGQQVNVGG